MPNSNADIDDLVAKGVRELLTEHKDGERLNVAAKARELGVYKDRLYRRIKGVGSRTTRKPVNHKLSAVQEASLLRYILSLDEIGHTIRYDQINSITNTILVEDHTNNDSVSSVDHHWIRRFLNRHPELYKVKQKSLELERKFVHDSGVLLDWFERFRQLRERYSVQNEDIWNFDETDFRIDVEKSQWIVTVSRKNRHYLSSDNNRDYVIVIEVISTDEVVINEILILLGKIHLERFYREL